MVTATITNPKSGKEYTLTVHNGKAVGCSCNQRKALEAYSPFAACLHMKEYNAPKTIRAEKSNGYWYPMHLVEGEWRYCVDVLNGSLHTMSFLTEEQALEYVKNEYPGAEARREALRKPVQPEVLWSNVCGHRVRFDVDSHCGCMA